MTFVHPSWIEGTIYLASWVLIPLILAIIIFGISLAKDSPTGFVVGIVFFILAIAGGLFIGPYMWHEQYEVPSVQEKVITVDNWQPTFGKYWGDVQTPSDLMMATKDGELFKNDENFLFQKFDTRDVFTHLKPNGTYKIKYYGWREGFNNGVPNILSVEEVIDENGTSSHSISNYMNKRSIVYGDDWDDSHY